MDSLAVSIIVPTYKEGGNIEELVKRVFAALADSNLDKSAEMIVVDDNSKDGTEETINKLKGRYPVRVEVRTKERGLSSAVIKGFELARGQYLLCMDADLQHPPESVPALVAKLQQGADFVTGTRYAGIGIDKDWPIYRQIISAGARLLARPLTPMSDPMTGFFALPATTFRKCVSKINPIGFKIALEVYVKADIKKPAEVPIRFGVRKAGESKLSSKVIVNYLNHLSQLYPAKFGLAPLLLVLLVLLFIIFQVLRFIF